MLGGFCFRNCFFVGRRAAVGTKKIEKCWPGVEVYLNFQGRYKIDTAIFFLPQVVLRLRLLNRNENTSYQHIGRERHHCNVVVVNCTHHKGSHCYIWPFPFCILRRNLATAKTRTTFLRKISADNKFGQNLFGSNFFSAEKDCGRFFFRLNHFLSVFQGGP